MKLDKSSSYKHLKPLQFYEDLYDLNTINECAMYKNGFLKKFPDLMKDPKFQEDSEETRKIEFLKCIHIVISTIKTYRFEKRKETISNWMKSDKELDEKYANTAPSEYYCPKCEVLLEVKCKDLHTGIDKSAKVSFLYLCPKCNYHARYFDDGTKYETEPTLCEKCKHEVKLHAEYDSENDIATWTNTCPKCQHVSITKYDFKKTSLERETREKREKEFLNKYRSKYCFTEEEGTKAVILQHGLAEFSKRLSEIKEKEQDPLYQKAKNLKKLKVIEINKLLSEELKKENYQNLIFEKPDIQRFVAVPFIVEDSKENRTGYDSERNLKSAITKILKDSNWRLMSEGVHYRAGYLNGKLRCYEREEELVSLLGQNGKRVE